MHALFDQSFEDIHLREHLLSCPPHFLQHLLGTRASTTRVSVLQNGNKVGAAGLEDRELPVLIELYLSTLGKQWRTRNGWEHLDTDVTSWHGVAVTGRCVQNLDLHRNGLTGSIPPAVSRLTAMRRLNLAGNLLSGGLPAELSALVNLTQLFLGGNQFTGRIPTSLTALQCLEELQLWANQLTGEFPPELCALPALREIWVQKNAFTGSFPMFPRSSRIQVISIYDNKLSGPIPPEVESLKRLTHLLCSGNQLDGRIPTQQLCTLTTLRKLSMHTNKFENPREAHVYAEKHIAGCEVSRKSAILYALLAMLTIC